MPHSFKWTPGPTCMTTWREVGRGWSSIHKALATTLERLWLTGQKMDGPTRTRAWAGQVQADRAAAQQQVRLGSQASLPQPAEEMGKPREVRLER